MQKVCSAATLCLKAGSSSVEFTIFAKGNGVEQLVITGFPLSLHKLVRKRQFTSMSGI